MLSVRRTLLTVLLALAALPAAAVAAGKGFFGLSLAVELDGAPANPTLRAVRIVKVLTASPAANAGLRRGDSIIAVEDRLLIGVNAAELDSLMQREVGQPLRLRVQRGDAEPFSVTLIADVARPE
jgi:C-terminal processing protease CtpA/Prc